MESVCKREKLERIVYSVQWTVWTHVLTNMVLTEFFNILNKCLGHFIFDDENPDNKPRFNKHRF